MRPFLTLHDPSLAKVYYKRGLWQSDTFYTLLAKHATDRPQQPALRDGRRILTWRDLHSHVDGAGAAMRALGLIAGDRVSIWLSNRAEAVITFLACSREGFACNPSLHRTYTSGEVVELLGQLNSRVLVTENGWGAGGQSEDVEDAGLCLKAIYVPANYPRPITEPANPPAPNPDRVSYLAFTSGTTGTPKCVMHSDNTLLANARDMVRDWSVGPETKLLTLSPLSHHIAWVAVAQWLVSGCFLITDDPPKDVSRLDWLTETGATYVMGVPTHAMDILAAQKERGQERLGAVKTFYMAGAPIPPAVAEAFVAQNIKPQNIYGMTENSSHQFTHPDDDIQTAIATCGRGGPAYEVRIFDAEDPDRLCDVGETGQIGGRGAALMLGYFDNQKATQESFNADGWFLSGDLGSLDAAGNLRIEGRLKDLIIRGGHNIYPSRIEALAVRHPAVDKAAAFPIPDTRLGEKVCLAVIGAIGADDLLRHLDREGLSRYDMPEYFLAVESFPLTASGKILKRELVSQLRAGTIAPQACRFAPPEKG